MFRNNDCQPLRIRIVERVCACFFTFIKCNFLPTVDKHTLYFFISKDSEINRFEGIIFVLIIVIYTCYLIEMSRREARGKVIELDHKVPEVKSKTLIIEIVILVIDLIRH